MKVAHITSAHPPYDQRILLKECRALNEAGHSVSYIVPHDHDEVFDGVRIKAIPTPKNRFERAFKTLRNVYKAAIEEDASAYHFHDSDLIPVGLLLKLRGKRVVYDVHEDLPRQILAKDWIPQNLRRPVAAVASVAERLAAAVLDGIVAATPIIADRFPSSKTVAVQNYPIATEFDTEQQVSYESREAVIAHVGRISETRGARQIVECMAYVPESLKARLILAGKFIPPMTEGDLRKYEGWKSVEFVGWQDRKQVGALLGRSRVGLVIMKPIRQYIESQPTKLYEYMAAGVPVVAADFPVWRKYVEEANCGLVVDPENPQDIAKAIAWLLENPQEAEAMGRRGQEAIRTRINWDHEAKILTDFYLNTIMGKRS